jgi:hypothetical protein
LVVVYFYLIPKFGEVDCDCLCQLNEEMESGVPYFAMFGDSTLLT